ncbi:TolC family outer membrane protein [Pseudomonas sp.]|uniref:TolC family outer membrane protein n=1 Tax=Pseudomonas sp. TaxID=306 RepID=UPI0028AC4D72|nr:TolC family outer membrane protein [Pseudomonas sp.]
MTRYAFLLQVMLCGLPAFVVPPLAYAAPVDLLHVYSQAIAQDARLNASRHQFQAQREDVAQAQAGLLPTLTLGATAETAQDDLAAGPQTRRGIGYQANLTQPLVRLDRWYGLKAAKAATNQAQLELADKEQALILQTAELYFDTLRAIDALAANAAEVKALHRQQGQAQARLADGAANITDVLDAQAAYDNALANHKRAEREVADAFEALNRLTRQNYTEIVGITHALPIQRPEPNDPSAWVEQGLRGNLGLLASTQAVGVAEQHIRQRQAGHAPTLDAVVSWRQSTLGQLGYSDPFAETRLAVELNIPLYLGGLTASQVRQSSERLSQRQHEHEDQRRELVLRIRNLHRAVNADIEQVHARRQSIRSSQASLKANQVGQVLGSRNTADVLDAERRLYRVVREYNDARYAYILDTLRLKQAAGSLAHQDLVELSRHLRAHGDRPHDLLPPPAQAGEPPETSRSG